MLICLQSTAFSIAWSISMRSKRRQKQKEYIFTACFFNFCSSNLFFPERQCTSKSRFCFWVTPKFEAKKPSNNGSSQHTSDPDGPSHCSVKIKPLFKIVGVLTHFDYHLVTWKSVSDSRTIETNIGKLCATAPTNMSFSASRQVTVAT